MPNSALSEAYIALITHIVTSNCTFYFSTELKSPKSTLVPEENLDDLVFKCSACTHVSSNISITPLLLSTDQKWVQTTKHRSACFILLLKNNNLATPAKSKTWIKPVVKHVNLTLNVFPVEWGELRSTRYTMFPTLIISHISSSIKINDLLVIAFPEILQKSNLILFRWKYGNVKQTGKFQKHWDCVMLVSCFTGNKFITLSAIKDWHVRIAIMTLNSPANPRKEESHK